MTNDNTERPIENVATVKESLTVEPVGDILDEPCFCDRNGIGAPGVSCGDCPIRDYKNTGR